MYWMLKLAIIPQINHLFAVIFSIIFMISTIDNLFFYFIIIIFYRVHID